MNFADINAIGKCLFNAGHVGIDNCLVALYREDKGHVHRDPG